MKYFVIAVAIVIGIFVASRMVVRNSPDLSRESGLHREDAHDPTIEAQEDVSIWRTQRENRNHAPRKP